MEVDTALRQEQGIDTKLSGTTAVVCLCRRQGGQIVLHTAHAGDSRAVAVVDGHAADLTEDHRPDLPTEQQRITEAGEMTRPTPPW